MGILSVYHWIFIVHDKLKVNWGKFCANRMENPRHMTSTLASTEYKEYPHFLKKSEYRVKNMCYFV